MTHFSPAFIKFFKDLSKNNSTAWFNENRKTYENEVKKPFAAFVGELISRAQKLDPEIQISPSEAITRINKDIRFSKDKIPYNTHVSAIISKTGKKSKEYPGMYIQVGPEKVVIFGGCYMPEKENLYKIRTYIAKNGKDFEKALSNADFKKKYGTIQGEKNKVLPPEFKKLVDKQPLIANKNFYFMAEIPAKEITSAKFADIVMDYYKSGRPVNSMLIKAFSK